LDLKGKIDYFWAAGWEEEWIDTAREIVQVEFNQGYAKICLEDSEDEEAMVVRFPVI